MAHSLFFLFFFSTCFFDSWLGFQGFSLFPVFLICIYLCINSSLKGYINITSIKVSLVLIIIFIISGFIVYTRYDNSWDAITPYIVAIIGVWCFNVTYSYFNVINTDYLYRIITLILIFQIFILIMQLIFWYFFSIDLNIGKIMGGNGHNAIGYDLSYRPTGIYDEPGIYAVFVYALFTIRYLLNTRLDVINLAAITSILLTNSIYGFLLIAIFFLWIFIFTKKVKGKILMVPFIVLILMLSSIFISERLLNILNGLDYSTFNKLSIIDYFIAIEDFSLFYGLGMLSKTHWPNFSFQAIGDLTFPISSIVIFGIPFGITLVICIVILISCGKINKYVLLVSIPFLKLSITNWIFFWIYIAMIKIVLNSKEPMNG